MKRLVREAIFRTGICCMKNEDMFGFIRDPIEPITLFLKPVSVAPWEYPETNGSLVFSSFQKMSDAGWVID